MATPTKSHKKKKQQAVSTKPQERQKHPDQWNDDLNPDQLEGQNIGSSSKRSDLTARSAADINVLAARLNNFSADELAQIPILPAGMKLKQGAVYLDMRIPAPVPFTVTADAEATESNYYAPKAEIPYELWNRLIEALGPAAMGEGAKGGEENRPFTPGRAAQESAVEEARDASLSVQAESDEIDDTLAESFPASDPPAWTTGREKNKEANISETTGADLNDLTDQQLNDKANELNIETSALNREQLILAIRSQLSGTEV